MACCKPLYITPKTRWNGDYFYLKEYQVPCGYCLNCRRDYQNYVVDRANYEYCKRLTASFVTVTYDDIHLIDSCAVRDFDGSLIFDIDSKGEKIVRTTLNYSDFTKFIDNIRHYVVNHKEIQNILCQPDFSYLYCGEYGDSFGRCHAHFLFFGLDFAYCKKIFMDKWKFGFIDVLPLLDGGIRYVCKYMDKFEKGLMAELKYDFKGLARPKLHFSKGFGQGLLWNNAQKIIDNNYCYESTHKTLRPISAYWKFLLTGGTVSRDVTKKDCWSKKDSYLKLKSDRCIRSLKEYNFTRENGYPVDSDMFQNAFKLRLAKIREKSIEIQLHNSLTPVPYEHFPIKSKFTYFTYDWKQIKKCSTRTLQALQYAYMEDLFNSLPKNYYFSEVS